MTSSYLPEKRALFLHVPRTGGTWLGRAMNIAGVPLEKWGTVCPMYRMRKHTILPHYSKGLLDRVDRIFSFVRHPKDYYVSVWRFTKRAVNIYPENMEQHVFQQKAASTIVEATYRWKPDFNEWMEEMLEEEPCWVTRWFERFVGPHRGEFCHYIGRLETLEQDAAELMGLLGYEERWKEAQPEIAKIKMSRRGVNQRQAPLIVWEPELLERVLRNERVAIRRFFGEESSKKRIYRNFLTGEPIW